MIRMPNANSCFLINSTGNAPKPAELMILLDSEVCYYRAVYIAEDALISRSRLECGGDTWRDLMD